jgi:hypothetical protein
MEYLDGKAAGSGEVESSSAVHILGLTGPHSCRLEPVVDVIDRLVRILHEAKLEPGIRGENASPTNASARRRQP